MSTTLNQRDFGDILGDTFRIYGRHFWKLLAITAIVLGALQVIATIAGFGLLSVVMTGWSIAALTGWLIVGLIIFVVASIIGGILMGGALIHAVSEQYLRQRISIRQAYSFAWRRLGAMLGAGILAFLAIGGLIAVSSFVATFSWVGWILVVAAIGASIYLIIRWVFMLPAALLEGLGPIAALSRSYGLVQNNWWRVLGITLVVGLISGAISAILGIIPVIGSIIGTILVTPIYLIAITLLYYDLRVRKEEYSLETLASELHINIEVASDSADAYYKRGDDYDEMGEYGKAIAEYSKAIELDPNHAPAYYNRGLAFSKTGEVSKAVGDLEKCIELSTDPKLIKDAKQVLFEIGNSSSKG